MSCRPPATATSRATPPRTVRRFGHRNGLPGTPRSGEALAALDDVERAARDLAEARGRLATSVDRLRAAGFGQQQIDGLLARRVADGHGGRPLTRPIVRRVPRRTRRVVRHAPAPNPAG